MTGNPQSPVIAALGRALLATDATLRRTQLAHWNVTGPQFFGLHAALESQYHNLFGALDDLAERIRALGAQVSSDYVSAPGKPVGDGDVIDELVQTHDEAVEAFKAASAIAAETGDEVTAGMILDRLEFHQKTLWMLKATR
ncbi:MAG: DNA starvation/stationary phase protection protein [Pseudomonadota bacterium]